MKASKQNLMFNEVQIAHVYVHAKRLDGLCLDVVPLRKHSHISSYFSESHWNAVAGGLNALLSFLLLSRFVDIGRLPSRGNRSVVFAETARQVVVNLLKAKLRRQGRRFATDHRPVIPACKSRSLRVHSIHSQREPYLIQSVLLILR